MAALSRQSATIFVIYLHSFRRWNLTCPDAILETAIPSARAIPLCYYPRHAFKKLVQETCASFDASSCTNFKFGRYIQSVNALKSVKNLGEKGAWTYPGTAQFFWVPHIISGTGKARKFKFGRYIHRLHACEQKPLKNLGEKGALAYPGTSQIFKYPLLSQERLKLRTSNFVCTF